MALGVVATGSSAAAGPALPTVTKGIATYTDTLGAVSSGNAALATDSTGTKIVVGASSSVNQVAKITATKVPMTAIPTLFSGVVPAFMAYDENTGESTGFIQVTSQENGGVYFAAVGFENPNKRGGMHIDLDGQQVGIFSGDGVGGVQGLYSNQGGIHCGSGVTQGSVFNFPSLKNNGAGIAIPQVTTTQRDAVNGGYLDAVFLYNSTLAKLQVYVAGWKTLTTEDVINLRPTTFTAVNPTTHTSGSPYAASFNEVLLGDFTTTGTAYATLPTAAAGDVGKVITVKVKTSGAASTLSVSAQTGETIAGTLSYAIDASAKNAVQFMVNAATQWIAI